MLAFCNKSMASFLLINPNKAGLFEGSFFWGGQFELPSYFKKNLSNINITYIIVKQSI